MFKKIENLHIGILGAGLAAHLRSQSIMKLESDRLKIVGVYDKNIQNLRAFEKELSIKAFTSFGDMLKSDDINTIAVCIPNKFHYWATKETLKSNRNVICEYPLVINDYSEAEELFEIAGKNKLLIHVGQTMNFDSDLSFALQNKDKLGKLYMGYKYTSFGKEDSLLPLPGDFQDLGKWYHDRDMTGGWMTSSCYHGIQIFRKIFGEVKRVGAVDSSNKVVGAGSVLLEHVDGSSSVVQWGFYIMGKMFSTFILSGAEGSIDIDEGKYLLHTSEVKEQGILPQKDGFYEDSKLLLDEINGKSDIDESNKDMLLCLKVSLLAQKSADEGREFRIH